jgi:hypothetical protein
MKCPVCRGKGTVYSAKQGDGIHGCKTCPRCFGRGHVKKKKGKRCETAAIEAWNQREVPKAVQELREWLISEGEKNALGNALAYDLDVPPAYPPPSIVVNEVLAKLRSLGLGGKDGG